MRFLLLGSLLFVACRPASDSGPEVVVVVPPEPIPEPEVLPPEEPEPAPRIIGNFHGVPIPEQGPWTKTLPRLGGTCSSDDPANGSHPLPPASRSIHYEAEDAKVRGVCALTVSDKPTRSPLLRVELEVRSGRVRVFVKYLGDIYFILDAEPGGVEVLEGAGIPGRGASLTVWVQALDGPAELEWVKVTSLN